MAAPSCTDRYTILVDDKLYEADFFIDGKGVLDRGGFLPDGTYLRTVLSLAFSIHR